MKSRSKFLWGPHNVCRIITYTFDIFWGFYAWNDSFNFIASYILSKIFAQRWWTRELWDFIFSKMTNPRIESKRLSINNFYSKLKPKHNSRVTHSTFNANFCWKLFFYCIFCCYRSKFCEKIILRYVKLNCFII